MREASEDFLHSTMLMQRKNLHDESHVYNGNFDLKFSGRLHILQTKTSLAFKKKKKKKKALLIYFCYIVSFKINII